MGGSSGKYCPTFLSLGEAQGMGESTYVTSVYGENVSQTVSSGLADAGNRTSSKRASIVSQEAAACAGSTSARETTELRYEEKLE